MAAVVDRWGTEPERQGRGKRWQVRWKDDLRADRRNPVPDRFGDELRPVIRPNVARHPSQDEKVGQDIYHGCRV